MIRMLRSGALAAATSTAALALVAVLEGKGAAQPLNATSHWLNGDGAARRRDMDLKHTAIGLATHVGATVFWAAFFEAWLFARPPHNAADILQRASAIAVLAAAIDYTITPRRFTPGWEFVITKRSMALVYAAMAGGFAVSALSRSTG